MNRRWPWICAALLGLVTVLSPQSLRAGDGAGELIALKEVDVMPKPITRVAPDYPQQMYRAGLTGKVTLSFVIDTGGAVINPVVVNSNNPWFERPAIEAILKWKFHPAEKDGQKVSVQVGQLVEFMVGRVEVEGLWRIPSLKDPEKLPPELRWHTAPVPLKSAFPVYPFAAVQQGVSGSTEIKFVVDPRGRVGASQVVRTSNDEMGLAMLAMIDTWEFTPPKKKDGTPCSAVLNLTHDFNLNVGSVPVSYEARQILKKLEGDPGEISKLSELDRQPRPLSRRPPIFPLKLREAGVSGQAMIEFFIDRNGDVQLPRIVSSTAPEFGYAAVQAVATWRFEPPLKAGKPVVARARIPLAFTPRKPAADQP